MLKNCTRIMFIKIGLTKFLIRSFWLFKCDKEVQKESIYMLRHRSLYNPRHKLVSKHVPKISPKILIIS